MIALLGRRQHQLEALPEDVVVVTEDALAFQQGLEPLGEFALKNLRQLDDQLFQLRQLLQALGQVLAGSCKGRRPSRRCHFRRGWGWVRRGWQWGARDL